MNIARALRTALMAMAGAAAASCASMAQPAGPEAAAPSQIAHGRQLAERNCAACHAIGKTGESPFPPAPHFRALGRKYPLDDLQEALAEGIVSGHPAMPQFQFTSTDVSDLIAYLKSIQTPVKAETITPR